MEYAKIQCLVSWKAFYANTRFDKYPAILCFPGYFRFAIYVICNEYLRMINIIDNNEEENKNFIISKDYEQKQKSTIQQINRFLSSLQILVDLIFSSNDDNVVIRVKPFKTISAELINMVRDKKNVRDFYFLEKYLVDESDKLNYQNALLQTSLKYHNAESVEHLIKILYEQGSCQDLDQTPIPRLPIPSIHYMHLVNHSNETPISDNIIGPRGWGPIYWNIFHTLPQNAQNVLSQTKYSEDEITRFLYCNIQCLPLLLPCPLCTIHFYETLNPDKIKYNNNIEEYNEIYDMIHKKVTEKLLQSTRK